MMIHNDGKDCGYTVKVGDDRPREGKMDRDFWVSFSENLFGQWSFQKWSETYFGTASGDGILWDMEASFERKHTLSVHGCNSRPVFWNSIMKTLLPVIEKSGYEETFVHRLVREKKKEMADLSPPIRYLYRLTLPFLHLQGRCLPCSSLHGMA